MGHDDGIATDGSILYVGPISLKQRCKRQGPDAQERRIKRQMQRESRRRNRH